MIDYSDKIKILSNEFLANRVKINIPVSDVLIVKNDVLAAGAFLSADENELVKVLDLALELKIPYLVLGSGYKHKFKGAIKGLLIVDKTRGIKIVGIKGKVGGKGIGVEEASVEVASGESIPKLNNFLDSHGLEQLISSENDDLTLGERVELDTNLRLRIEKLKIWDQGQVYKCNLFDFNKNRHVIIGLVIKMKAR